MKFLDKIRKVLLLPDTIEKLNDRIEKLEKLQNQTQNWRITTPMYDNASRPVIAYTTCPGGCEFPTHYVGDYIPCKKCGRQLEGVKTIITC